MLIRLHILLNASAFLVALIGMLTPGFHKPLGIPDPIAHILVLFGLSFFFFAGRFFSVNLSILILLCVAIILELGQFFVPGRSVEAIDFVCNFYGVFLAYFMTKTIQYSRPNT